MAFQIEKERIDQVPAAMLVQARMQSVEAFASGCGSVHAGGFKPQEALALEKRLPA